MILTKVEVTPDGPKKAQATGMFDNGGKRTTVRYYLEAMDGKWRIAHISDPGLEGMPRALAEGIASRAKELAK